MHGDKGKEVDSLTTQKREYKGRTINRNAGKLEGIEPTLTPRLRQPRIKSPLLYH